MGNNKVITEPEYLELIDRLEAAEKKYREAEKKYKEIAEKAIIWGNEPPEEGKELKKYRAEFQKEKGALEHVYGYLGGVVTADFKGFTYLYKGIHFVTDDDDGVFTHYEKGSKRKICKKNGHTNIDFVNTQHYELVEKEDKYGIFPKRF